MDTCLYREQRGSPGHPPWYYCQMRARQVRPDHDCRTDACRTLAAIAAKSARKEEPAMSEPIRRLKWDAPASQADPEFTDERSLREHVRGMVASIAEQLGVAPVTVTGALRRQSKPGAAAPQPSQPAAAAPQPAAIAAKSARKEEPAMSEPIRRLKWDAPASQADPEFTDELRKHVRRMVASIAEQLDVAPVTVTGALRRQSKPGAAAPAPQPSQPAAAAPQPAATAAPAALAPTPAAPAVAPSDDWCVARDLVAHANPDELAEFFAAYDLSDRFDAFVTGLRRPRRSA